MFIQKQKWCMMVVIVATMICGDDGGSDGGWMMSVVIVEVFLFVYVGIQKSHIGMKNNNEGVYIVMGIQVRLA